MEEVDVAEAHLERENADTQLYTSHGRTNRRVSHGFNTASKITILSASIGTKHTNFG